MIEIIKELQQAIYTRDYWEDRLEALERGKKVYLQVPDITRGLSLSSITLESGDELYEGCCQYMQGKYNEADDKFQEISATLYTYKQSELVDLLVKVTEFYQPPNIIQQVKVENINKDILNKNKTTMIPSVFIQPPFDK